MESQEGEVDNRPPLASFKHNVLIDFFNNYFHFAEGVSCTGTEELCHILWNKKFITVLRRALHCSLPESE
jgi:hypothetical protein